MKRLFIIKDWFAQTYTTRTLEIGDNVRIRDITYRIMEDPYDGLIMCTPHDPNMSHKYIQFHENDVDELIWADYEEYSSL